MATSTYMAGRSKYERPQAVVWCNSYQLDSGLLVPSGTEFEDFIVLSDHNRSTIAVANDRIENRKRMINGTMRSYHVVDKERFSLKWDMLPSRAFDEDPQFDSNTGKPATPYVMHTADGGAGGWDLANWYDTHSGPFSMLLSYDKGDAYGQTAKYTRALTVYFASFGYEVVKRGITDFWNISAELEEV